nr:glutathione S-transferase T3-like [Tanacetum cinerariifolium]
MHGDCQRFNGIYKHLNRKSRESDADLVENAKTIYINRYGKKKLYPHVWSILKIYPKWNVAESIDEDNLQELFGLIQESVPPANNGLRKSKNRLKRQASGKASEGAPGGVNRSPYRRLFLMIIDGDDDNMAQKRAVTRWNRDKEILLAETWIEHSQDANIKKDQQDDIYWKLIMEDFNSQTTSDPRTKTTMTGKWTRMHDDCQ